MPDITSAQTGVANEGPGSSAPPESTNRRSLRVPFSRDHIDLVLLGPDGEREETQVTGRNISKGGVGVLIEREVPQGQRVEITMQTMAGQTSQMPGKVVFARPVHNALHEIGIAFEELIDLEQYVTLQRVQRMIYEKEKRAAAAKAERIHAHANAQAAAGAAAAPAAPRAIVSKLAGKPGMEQKLQAYAQELSARTQSLTEAAAADDLATMRAVAEWIIETAQPHGYPTLSAVANVTSSYLEDDQPDDLATIREQVKELLNYLKRAGA
jgi:hypothetical protein